MAQDVRMIVLWRHSYLFSLYKCGCLIFFNLFQSSATTITVLYIKECDKCSPNTDSLDPKSFERCLQFPFTEASKLHIVVAQCDCAGLIQAIVTNQKNFGCSRE